MMETKKVHLVDPLQYFLPYKQHRNTLAYIHVKNDMMMCVQVSPDTATPVNMAVKLRKTPSPKQERPKSDITVRWADLLEQVRETNITYRNDGQTIRKRPRPKSDLGK